ncbi:MAG: CHAT domain-containing tetratricopeptide repeat protein [Hyphomicrobium sp.]
MSASRNGERGTGHRLVRHWRSSAFATLPALILALGLACLAGSSPRANAQTNPAQELADLRALSNSFYETKSYAEALRFANEAHDLIKRTFGPDSEEAGIQTYSLGLIAEEGGWLDVAETHYAASVRIREKVYGVDSAGSAQALEKLGGVVMRAGRLDEAEPILRRVLVIRRDLVGADHSFTSGALADLGRLQLKRGRTAAALADLREAVRLLTTQSSSMTLAKSVIDDDIRRHRDVFTALMQAAWDSRSEPGASSAALLAETFAVSQQAWNTSAASALARMTARLGASATPLGRRIRDAQDSAERILALHSEDMAALTAWSAVQRADATYSAHLDEFRRVAITQSRDTAPIVKRQRELVDELTRIHARCPNGAEAAGCSASTEEISAISQELGRLSTEANRGTSGLMAINQRMQAAERALPGYDEYNNRREARLEEMTRLEAVVAEKRRAIVAEHPDYVALADPQPLAPAEVQALLGPDEALVAILTGTEASFVWALTREASQWAPLGAGAGKIAEEVSALRRGLDPLAAPGEPVAATGAPSGAVTRGFDLGRSHALYRMVLGPVAPLIARKTHLIVVPTGPLTSLPLQVLVTEPPPAAGGAAALKQAAWLIRRHALSTLPSVASLKALRSARLAGVPPKPFLGIGDPVLQGATPDSSGPRGARGPATVAAPHAVYRNGQTDLRAVAALQPLPETAAEIRTIARILGAGDDGILVGGSATEARVKATPLEQYRVIHFATHGLVAGELSGLAEPALVMTPPATPSETDDGLLTASEIATLRLGADWVVLSACNTAAGDKTGAEALSGLARTFFYAGARALLVSHWAVNSQAAVDLTTGAFAALAGEPKLGRAEVLRRAMLAQIEAGKPPGYWAPFVMVGEGGARR